MTLLRRYGWLAIAPAFALLIYWRAPITWFSNDDFAWLGMPLQVKDAATLVHVLFVPKAQGTVRVLGDRLYFLTLAEIFGFNAMPYHLVSLAVWCADLVLAALIGARLTGSKAAGALAATLWTASSVLVKPVAWASGFDEVLCAFCILAAFYARLRGRRVLEWIAYLAGFGALEVIVMYPAIAALYSLCADRKRLRETIPLFVPAIAFTALRFALIPPDPGPYYRLYFDSRMPSTLLQYLKWGLGPSRIAELTGHGGRIGTRIMWAIALSLAVFLIVRLLRREWIAAFFAGWFVLLIAPVLPLANHVIDYYATIPELGAAWLGAWAIVLAWRAHWIARALAVLLAAGFVGGSMIEVNAYTEWNYDRSVRIKRLFFGVRDALRTHPSETIILQGIDNELFVSGFQDEPFRLIGVHKVQLAPGNERSIVAREDLGGVSPFMLSLRQAYSILNHGDARVIRFDPRQVRDVTGEYLAALRADPRATRVDSVDAGDPNAKDLLGPTWYPAEGGFRWMPKSATVKLSGPETVAQRLFITGYAPKAIVAAGPVTMTIAVNGREIGKAVVKTPDARFAFDFALPPEFVGKELVQIAIEVDKVLRMAGDERELGMIFGTFAIR